MKQNLFLCGNTITQKTFFAGITLLALMFLLPYGSAAQVRKDLPETTKNNTAQFPAANGGFSKASLTYKIISSVNKTWGYDIYVEGKLLVHQPSVPALPGNEGFKTKEAAGKVATKVIEKIRKGENPPSITIEEMKALKAI